MAGLVCGVVSALLAVEGVTVLQPVLLEPLAIAVGGTGILFSLLSRPRTGLAWMAFAIGLIAVLSGGFELALLALVRAMRG